MHWGTSTRDLLLVVLTLLLTVRQGVECQGWEPKIVNGNQVSSIRGYEHQVSLRLASFENNQFGSGFSCGGSLIRHDLVLTAAHCVHDANRNRYYSASNYVIVMGSIYLARRDNNTLEISAKRIVGHTNYKSSTFANDIALIFLSRNVSVNHPTVRPIALSNTALPVGAWCKISGWGHTSYEGNPSAVLIAGDVILNSRSSCNRIDRYAGDVLVGMFCAGNFTGRNLVDTCQGDSGELVF